MAKKNVVGRVFELAEPIVKQQGLKLWDVRFEKEGSNMFLRIIIEADGRDIGFDDCEKVSRALDPVLDEEDPIDQSYFLEVSSPGLNRELRRPEHFSTMTGRDVLVKLIRPYEGEREFCGVLSGEADGAVTINCGEDMYSFNISECAYIKLDDDKLTEGEL